MKDVPHAAVSGALPILLSIAGCSGPEPPSIVLIVIDTLRADALEPHGAAPGSSPRLDELAREGVVFDAALGVSPWTGPSVASIVTGMYPDELGIHDFRDAMPSSVVTLAERFSGAGYSTGAVVSNGLAGPAYRHDQGFEDFHFRHYKGRRRDVGDELAGRPVFTADRVSDAALAWIGTATSPFFLHVHYTDPHEPYLPPPRWLARTSETLDDEAILEKRFTSGDVAEEMLDRVRAHYAAEVAFVDHELGRLLDGLPDDAFVVVVGDHGEEFLEHGGFFHGRTLFEEILRIPLIMKGPDVAAGGRIDVPVSQVDIAPTLLEVAGLDAMDELSGRSLVSAISVGSNARTASPHIFSMLEDRSGSARYAVRSGSWKLVADGPTETIRLYDLERDPGETEDVAGRHTSIATTLQRALGQKLRLSVPTPDEDPGSEADREAELRAIGYIE